MPADTSRLDFRKRSMPAAGLGSFLLILAYAALRPGSFSSAENLGALIFLEILLVAIGNYGKAFVWLLLVCFFWAGMNVPLASAWTTGRWMVLAVGAAVGIFMQLRDRSFHARSFDILSLLCLVAAAVSGSVSAYPTEALLKALSLTLLFMYGWFGARLALRTSEQLFFSVLLASCEWLVYATAFSYFVLHISIFGNANSLGAVQAVVAVPTLLWGIVSASSPGVRHRRSVALGIALLLLFSSYSRAAIVAATGSCIFMCLGLRRYRLFVQLLISALLLAAVAAALFPLQNAPAESLSSTYLYKGRREGGILESRKSPWEHAISAIEEHPWFGSGFGTSLTGEEDSQEPTIVFYSAPQATREHGNSYLAVMEWTGLFGCIPFLALVVLLLARTFSIARWMRRSGWPSNPSVLLAAIVLAGLLDAVFEDWLFAPGYHLCILVWTCAFMLMDLAPPVISRFSPLCTAVPVGQTQ